MPDSVGLDTSIVLRLLTGEPSDQFKEAVGFLDSLLHDGQTAAISDLVISEAYHALQYHYGVPKAEALATLASLLESSEIEGIGVAGKILETPDLASSKPGFVDRMIHGEYTTRCEEMATFEKAARKLPRTRVLT